MKKFLWAIPLALLVAYIFALPYITVYQIKQAVDNQDSAALSEHIDFPAVRQNLKEQLNAMLLEKTQGDGDSGGNAMAVLGMAFAGALVDKLLEAYVTPAGIAQMMAGKKPSRKKSQRNDMPAPEQTADSAALPDNSADTKPMSGASMAYRSSSRFEIIDNKQGTRFVLHRQGLEWKLAEIHLPASLLDKK